MPAGAEIVTDAYEALNRGDVEGALEPLAEDAEWMEHSDLPEAGWQHLLEHLALHREGRVRARVMSAVAQVYCKRSFGLVRLPRGPRTLRLRAYVRGAGRSNIVTVRVGR